MGLELRAQPRHPAPGKPEHQRRARPPYLVRGGPVCDQCGGPHGHRPYGRRYVFAGLNRTTLSFDTRVNVTFTPDLSLQLYLEQPFISIGDYGQLREFAEPDSYDFFDYGGEAGTLERNDDGSYQVDPDGAGPAADFRFSNRDFNYRSLIGNAVLRWEWRPGSTLYLVWQQRRIDSVTGADDTGNYGWVGDFDLSRDTQDMFSTKPDNVFAIKVNYWLNP